MKNKNKGYRGESIAKNHYLKKGYKFVKSNFTIRGGEIDLIFKSKNKLVFIEVKVVNSISQLQDYITKSKLQTLHKTIQTYLYKYQKDTHPRLDFVFIKNNQILEVYEDIDL